MPSHEFSEDHLRTVRGHLVNLAREHMWVSPQEIWAVFGSTTPKQEFIREASIRFMAAWDSGPDVAVKAAQQLWDKLTEVVE
jgi:hypothetical protein